MAIFAGDGSSTAPSYTFSSDTNMGWYRESATKLSFVNNSATNATLEEGGMTFRRADGNAEIRSTGTNTFLAGTPLYTFYNSNTTGIGCPASGSVSIITGGSERFRAVTGGGIGVNIGSATTYGNFDIFGASNPLDLVYNDFKATGGGTREVGIDFRSGGTTAERNGSIARIAGIDRYTGGSFEGAIGFFTQTSGGNAQLRATIENDGSFRLGGTLPSSPNFQVTSSGAITAGTITADRVSWSGSYTQPTISGLPNGGTTTFDVPLPTGVSMFFVSLSASANGGDKVGNAVAVLSGYNDGVTRRRSFTEIHTAGGFSFTANSLSGSTVTITITNSTTYTGHLGTVRVIRLV